MKKLITIILLLAFTFAKSQVINVTVDGKSVYTSNVKRDTIYKDTGKTVFVPGPVQYIHDTFYTTPPVVIPPVGTKTVTLSFNQFAGNFQRQGAGAEQWNGQYLVPLYNQATDAYDRFSWVQFEGSVQGSYSWGLFDSYINAAIQKGQKFSFGIMTLNPDGGGVSYGGGSSYYPQYLHNLMQSEGTKDWLHNGVWMPNYNSQNYLNRLLALYQTINAHLETGTFNGVRYKDVIGYIDIRGYGSWGEWHHGSLVDNVSEIPSGARATTATLKRIIDIHTQGFPNYHLVAMIAAFDANRLPMIMNPPEVGLYALQAKNNAGDVGWRRDQWGATDGYLSDYLENNNVTVNGFVLKDLIMNKWKTAPIVGEPPSWNTEDYKYLLEQIVRYHATSFGNANFGSSVNANITANVKVSDAAAGYRITLTGGTVTTGTTTTIKLDWSNLARPPTYENWDVLFQVNGVTIGKSIFKPKLFIGTQTSIDTFTGVTVGKLTVKIVDPNGYRKSMTLGITGQNTDGSYTLVP